MPQGLRSSSMGSLGGYTIGTLHQSSGNWSKIVTDLSRQNSSCCAQRQRHDAVARFKYATPLGHCYPCLWQGTTHQRRAALRSAASGWASFSASSSRIMIDWPVDRGEECHTSALDTVSLGPASGSLEASLSGCISLDRTRWLIDSHSRYIPSRRLSTRTMNSSRITATVLIVVAALLALHSIPGELPNSPQILPR